MNDYDDLHALSLTRKRKLANNTYLAVRDDGGLGVRLHDTEVVVHYPDRVVLDSGGWQTVTTKNRMNEYSALRVYSERGVWHVQDRAGDVFPFQDGITFYESGTVAGAGPDPRATEKLRKRVNAYAAAYAAALLAGEVPQPSGGDCWCCCMVAKDGTAPMGGADHVLSHLDEKYYVPSILSRTGDYLSPVTRGIIGQIWRGDADRSHSWDDMVRGQVRKAVRRFCFLELGLAA